MAMLILSLTLLLSFPLTVAGSCYGLSENELLVRQIESRAERHLLVAECFNEPRDIQGQLVIGGNPLEAVVNAHYGAQVLQHSWFKKAFDVETKLTPMVLLKEEMERYLMQRPSEATMLLAYNSSLNAYWAVEHIYHDSVQRAVRGNCYWAYPRFMQESRELLDQLRHISCALRQLAMEMNPAATGTIRRWLDSPYSNHLWNSWKCQQGQVQSDSSMCLWRDYYLLQLTADFLLVTQHHLRHNGYIHGGESLF